MFGKKVKLTIDKIRTWGILGTIIGVLLILIGIFLIVFPVVPGFPLVIIGLLIIGIEIPFLKRLEKKLLEEKKAGKKKNINTK